MGRIEKDGQRILEYADPASVCSIVDLSLSVVVHSYRANNHCPVGGLADRITQFVEQNG